MLFVVKQDPALTKEALVGLLRQAAHRLQAAEIHRVPRRAAEDQCRQDPAPRTARRRAEEGGLTRNRRLQPPAPFTFSRQISAGGAPAMTPAKLFAVAAVGPVRRRLQLQFDHHDPPLPPWSRAGRRRRGARAGLRRLRLHAGHRSSTIAASSVSRPARAGGRVPTRLCRGPARRRRPDACYPTVCSPARAL